MAGKGTLNYCLLYLVPCVMPFTVFLQNIATNGLAGGSNA
jgi:hypothetical protein